MGAIPRVFAVFTSLWVGLVAATVEADGPLRLSHRDRLYDAAEFDGSVFVVGHPGLLLRSRDGGRSFEGLSVGQKDEALFSVAFNAKGQGGIVGRSGCVFATRDGGATWQRSTVVLGDDKPSLFGVAVLDDGVIVAVGEFGAIVRSEDHGRTWTRSAYSVVLPGGELAPTALCPALDADGDNSDVIQEARLTDVAFVDRTVGFIVGEFGLVLRTGDGGRSFQRLNACTNKTLYGVAVIDARGVLVAGANGSVVETGDGGATWSVLPTGTSEHLFGVFADSGRALVMGAAGTLLTRTGRGALGLVDTGLHSWLTSAWLNGKGGGVIVGGRAHILATQDGGNTQHRVSGE